MTTDIPNGQTPTSNGPTSNGVGSGATTSSQGEGVRWEGFLDLLHNATTMRREWFQKLFDPRRNIDQECGYPDSGTAVSIELYRQLFDRDPIANRVVQVMARESWQQPPSIYEDEDTETVTPFEEAWDGLSAGMMGNTWFKQEQGSTLQEYMLRLDILSGIGRYGVLLLGVNDGKNLQDPIDGMVTINRRLEPVYKDRITTNSDGSKETDKVVAGMRSVRVSNTTLLPDSPMLAHELDSLREVTANQSVTRFIPVFEKGQPYREKVVTQKIALLNDYNFSPSTPKPTANKTAKHASEIIDDQYGRGFPGNPIGNPNTATTTKDSDPHDPKSLLGTDAQYFGVQFGPSEQPSDKPATYTEGEGGLKLTFVKPFDESLVQVVRYEWNVNNPRFGQPVMYRITLNDPRDQQSGIGLPLATVYVHWTRVIHVADNRLSSDIFGVPRQQPVLNCILDIRKVRGGSAEMYWQGAFPGIALSTVPQLGGDVKIDKEGLRDMMSDYSNGLQRWLALMGMQANTLAPQVVDPVGQITVQEEALCIQLSMPVRIFKGSERGELASTQDDASWNDRITARRNYHVTPHIIVPLVDRLISVGILPEPEEYYARWPDLDSQTDLDKANIANTKTMAMSAYVSGQVESLMCPLDYLTRIMGFDEEEATEIIEAAKAAHEEAETMTMPQMVGGREAAAPPGTQDHADAEAAKEQFQQQTEMKQDQFGQQMDLKKQQIASKPPTSSSKPSGAK